MVHFIALELNGARLPDEVARIERAIQSMGDAYAFQRTCWFVETERSNREICATLAELLRPKDRLIVTRIHRDWVSANVADVETEWLSQRNFHSPNDAAAVVSPVPPR